MSTDTAQIENITEQLQTIIKGAKDLTDKAILAQQALSRFNSELVNQELKAQLDAAEQAEIERVKQLMGDRPQINVDPNMPLMDRLFPKSQPVPMPAYEVPGRMPIGTTNPVSPTVIVTNGTNVVAEKPKNLTNEARALIQTGHSYERAVRKLQDKYPNHPADHVRRAVGRARDGR